MKILVNCSVPFSLSHGGQAIQIQHTISSLEKIGVNAEPLRWWDEQQAGDIIHFFGPPGDAPTDLIHSKGIKLVVTHLLGGLGARSSRKRWLQKQIIHLARRTLSDQAFTRTGWRDWRTADACIAITTWEAQLMREVFEAPSERVHVVPNGVDDFFFEQPSETRGAWLITTASILPVKRLVETAKAAVAAQTPYWVIGRPFSESDDYYRQFAKLCQAHPKLLRHDNVMRSQRELAQIYRQARGFVLLSRWETQSLSAIEAAACECPLLLADLPWARSTFGSGATFCPVTDDAVTMAKALRKFYDAAPQLPPPPKPATWNEVAQQLKIIYEQVLKKDIVL